MLVTLSAPLPLPEMERMGWGGSARAAELAASNNSAAIATGRDSREGARSESDNTAILVNKCNTRRLRGYRTFVGLSAGACSCGSRRQRRQKMRGRRETPPQN